MGCDEATVLLLQNRLFLYELLFRVFASEPDDGLLGALRDDHVASECALLDDDDCARGAEVGRQLVDAARATALEELRGQYTRNFIGPASLPVPPWESVFVERKPVLFQRNTLAVRAAYRDAGFKAAGYPHEADDHLGTELSFMAALARQTLGAAEEGDSGRFGLLVQVQRSFLVEHLLVWVDEYAQRLTDELGTHSVYGAASRMAALACRRDSDLLGELAALG